MAAVLKEIADSPSPDYQGSLREILTTIRIGLEHERGARGYYRKIRADAGRWQRVNSLPVVGQALAARRKLKMKRLAREDD